MVYYLNSNIDTNDSIESLDIEWILDDYVIYNRKFYGNIVGNNFCLVNNYKFNDEDFLNFIKSIITKTSCRFSLNDMWNSYEGYSYNANSNCLRVEFSVCENQMSVNFRVDETLINVLEIMLYKIKAYRDSLYNKKN